MAYEVEMKAWVDDWKALEATLRERSGFRRSFRKEDRYYRMDVERNEDATLKRADPGFRIRMEGERACVTFKRKSRRGSAEVNLEREFRVDDTRAFLDLMMRTGYFQEFAKVKEGLRFEHDGLVAELAHVEELGDFLEVESIGANDDEAAHATAVRRITAFMTDCGIGSDRIEERPYMTLLRTARARSATRSSSDRRAPPE